MKEVDWSKAPEDATHFQPAYSYWDNPVFWRIEGGVVREVWVVRSFDEDVSAHFTYGPEGNDCYIPERCIERPTQAWSGEGLPPIGAICEVQHSNMRWYRCKIFAVRGREALFDLESGQPDSWDSADLSCFRPIKTQEQIAAEEEREKAIDAIYDILYTSNTWTTAAVALYDAGYRLTKIEE